MWKQLKIQIDGGFSCEPTKIPSRVNSSVNKNKTTGQFR